MTAPAQSPAAGEVMAAFADPSAIGGTRPAVRDLVGRVVVIKPTRYEERVPGVDPGTFQERITADVLILDGGHLEFGGNPTRGRPNLLAVNAPYLTQGMYISNTNIVGAVRDQTGKGVVLGRIVQGRSNDPKRNAPYNLVMLDEADPMRAAAAQLYTTVLKGTFVNPEPVKIGAVITTGAPAHVQNAQVQVAAAAADPEFLAWKKAQAAAAAPVETPEQAAQRKFAEWQAAEAAKLAPTAPVEEIPEAPTGWDATMWRSLQPEQRRQVLEGAPPFK
jgi:hypothetical protein